MRKFLALLALLVPTASVLFLVSEPQPVIHATATATNAQAAKRPSEQFYPLVQKLFPRLDKDNNGYVTAADIDRAILQDHTIKGDLAQALYALRASFSDLASTSGKVTLADVEKFNRTLPVAVSKNIDDQMDHARNFLSKVNRGLYPSGTQAESLRKMVLLSQVNRGNCYFQSGFSSCASIDPQKILGIITDNGVNSKGVRTYTVRFPRAPGEAFTVEEFTEVGLLVNDVQEDSGTWMSVIIRAYGMYQKDHPTVRWLQRWFFSLNGKILPEDITDQGSMCNDGLRMCSSPDTRVKEILWGLDKDHLKNESGRILMEALQRFIREAPDADLGIFSQYFGSGIQDLVRVLRTVDESYIKGALAQWVANQLERFLVAAMYQPRDPSVVHEQLKHSMVDNNLPATVIKYGGAHEASILAYRPGTVSADGKHTSKYGFITVRDQAWLSDEEQEMVTKGIWFREPGMDERTVCMSVEEFTKYYTGFASVIKKK